MGVSRVDQEKTALELMARIRHIDGVVAVRDRPVPECPAMRSWRAAAFTEPASPREVLAVVEDQVVVALAEPGHGPGDDGLGAVRREYSGRPELNPASPPLWR